eukprot:scaffold2292_cov301-Pavlova_lutheri.AAC.5
MGPGEDIDTFPRRYRSEEGRREARRVLPQNGLEASRTQSFHQTTRIEGRGEEAKETLVTHVRLVDREKREPVHGKKTGAAQHVGEHGSRRGNATPAREQLRLQSVLELQHAQERRATAPGGRVLPAGRVPAVRRGRSLRPLVVQPGRAPHHHR